MPTPRSSQRFSAKQSKKTSAQLNSSTLGAHQVNARVGRKNRMNAADMHLSSTRRSRRASHGVVSNVGTSSSSGENGRAYARRSSQAYTQGYKKSGLLKGPLFLLLLIVVVVAVGFFVATRVFFGVTGGRMALSDTGTSSYLKAASANAPYYTLFVADLDETNNCDTDVDMVVLARMDEQGKALTCLAFPSSLSVAMRDGQDHPLKDAVYVGGYSELLRVVTVLSDVDITHLVTLKQADIEALVDSWGGLQWNLTEEVDDPSAGSLYIPAGQQTLNGAQLTTLLRARNFSKGIEQQGLNQCEFVADFLEKSSCEGGLAAASSLDSVSKYLHTDWGAEALMNTLAAFDGFQASSAYKAFIPCYQSGTGSDPLYSVSSSDLQSMMAYTNIGSDPNLATATGSAASISPGSFTITVRNGSGVTGGASTIANILTEKGYNVTETGNTDSYVYTETLIVYLDDGIEPAAQSVCQALGMGRVIDGTNHYTFDTDVLVILGSDWMPQS